MANAIYRKFLERCLAAGLNGLPLKCAAVNGAGAGTLYVPNTLTDQMFSSVPPLSILRVTGNLSSVSFVDGILRADNLAPAFAALAGITFEFLVVFVDTGNPATSPLVCIYDTATGLPLIPNGTNVDLTWDPSGVLAL